MKFSIYFLFFSIYFGTFVIVICLLYGKKGVKS